MCATGTANVDLPYLEWTYPAADPFSRVNHLLLRSQGGNYHHQLSSRQLPGCCSAVPKVPAGFLSCPHAALARHSSACSACNAHERYSHFVPYRPPLRPPSHLPPRCCSLVAPACAAGTFPALLRHPVHPFRRFRPYPFPLKVWMTRHGGGSYHPWSGEAWGQMDLREWAMRRGECEPASGREHPTQLTHWQSKASMLLLQWTTFYPACRVQDGLWSQIA